MDELNKANARFGILYWLLMIAVINLIGFLVSWKYVWIIGIAAGILSSPVGRAVQKRMYIRLTRRA